MMLYSPEQVHDWALDHGLSEQQAVKLAARAAYDWFLDLTRISLEADLLGGRP